MRNHKSAIWIALLGMLLAVFVVSAAQTPKPTDQKKQEAASCCSDSGCCKGGSCPMNKEGASASEAKDQCCCGGADSCDMDKHEGMANHAAGVAGEGCSCCSDSCDTQSQDKKQNHQSNESCCCDMKMKQKDTKQPKT